jgi:TPR repeat protein
MDSEETKNKFDIAVSLYNSGRYDEALPHFEALAEQEHAGARYYLISHHRWKWAQKTAPATRLEWLQKAAEEGIAAAQYDLGGCYMVGTVVKADYEKAEEWFRKAAAQGHKGAMDDLKFIKDYHDKQNPKQKQETPELCKACMSGEMRVHCEVCTRLRDLD